MFIIQRFFNTLINFQSKLTKVCHTHWIGLIGQFTSCDRSLFSRRDRLKMLRKQIKSKSNKSTEKLPFKLIESFLKMNVTISTILFSDNKPKQQSITAISQQMRYLEKEERDKDKVCKIKHNIMSIFYKNKKERWH